MLDKKGYERLEKNAKIEYIPGGSDREFYRIKEGEYSTIAMFTSVQREVKEFRRIQKFLSERGVGVPEIYISDSSSYLVLMEDLGSESLYNLVKDTPDWDFIEYIYKRIIEFLIFMQIEINKDIKKCKTVYNRIFNYDDFRFETTCFRFFFLQKFCKFSEDELKELDNEFDNLASMLAREPLFFMHRDFQSTNIFLKNGFIRTVDFQDAHRGLLTYDIASLLRDAYVKLPRQLRNKLFSYYYSLLRIKTNLYKDIVRFRKIYVLTAIQRNMQALGAFIRLSEFSEKKWFKKAIPAGVEFLKEGLDEVGEFNLLRGILDSPKVKKCVKSICS